MAAPTLTVVRPPAPPADAILLAAARRAFGEALDSLGVTSQPADPRTMRATDAFLTALLQAHGLTVELPNDAIAADAQRVIESARLAPMEVAS